MRNQIVKAKMLKATGSKSEEKIKNQLNNILKKYCDGWHGKINIRIGLDDNDFIMNKKSIIIELYL
jgi:hypothetical protein